MIYLYAAFIVKIKYKSSNLVIYCMRMWSGRMSRCVLVQHLAWHVFQWFLRVSWCPPLSERAVHLHLLVCCPDRHHMEHNIWQLFGNSNKNECWDLNSSIPSTRLSPCQQAHFDGWLFQAGGKKGICFPFILKSNSYIYSIYDKKTPI